MVGLYLIRSWGLKAFTKRRNGPVFPVVLVLGGTV